jgi:hypothetical protein
MTYPNVPLAERVLPLHRQLMVNLRKTQGFVQGIASSASVDKRSSSDKASSAPVGWQFKLWESRGDLA